MSHKSFQLNYQVTCTITEEKTRITGEQWVWEHTSACCTWAAAEVIQIQWDVTGDRLVLQTSELTAGKTYSCLDLTFWCRLVFSSGRENTTTILCRRRDSSRYIPASSQLQAFTPGITVLGLSICDTRIQERALGCFLFNSPRTGRMKTLQMNCHYVDADVYLHGVLSPTSSTHWELQGHRRKDMCKHSQCIKWYNPSCQLTDFCLKLCWQQWENENQTHQTSKMHHLLLGACSRISLLWSSGTF